MTTFPLDDGGVYRYVVKLSDISDFQGQVFMFRNFLCISIGKVMGEGNCYICVAVLFTVEVYYYYHHHHPLRTLVCFVSV